MPPLDSKLAALTTMSSGRLRAEWLQLYKKPAPDLTADLLRRGIAYRLQKKAHGGLSPATLREIERMRRHLSATGEAMTLPAIRIKPGTRLVRDWGGASHHVVVLDSGFLYREQRYRSLSTIAAEIRVRNGQAPASSVCGAPSMRKPICDTAPRKIRCAIYTRKSSEEGLEQEFNSLDAQREACAAYIVSQRHEGWVALADIYDDGGYSGGNMDRPGLKALMAEVAAKRVDVIVVYKVDRLTRSLADFARIVDVLDDTGASFVSVTQSFNTTSSMGRLTLNVLLSFAQFEREVTGERIRDKIAASKAKGMWMGGPVPLGYRLEERHLLIEPDEADTVRMIFRRFIELGSGRLLVAELDRLGIRSKPRTNRHGRAYGEQPISRGALYAILRNRLYIGEIVHKGQSYPGRQQAIIPAATFDQVQQQLDAATVERRHRTNADQPSLLAGLLIDGHGRRMSPSHAVKAGKRYRYYASQQDGEAASATPAWRISAGEIEALVLAEVTGVIRKSAIERIAAGDLSGDDIAQIEDRLQRMITSLEAPSTSRANLLQIVERIDIGEGALSIAMKQDQLQTADDDEATIVATVPLACVRRGRGIRIVVPPRGQGERARNPALLKLVAQAYAARDEMERGGSFDEMAARLGCGTENLADMIRMSFLSPNIIIAIVEGRQPAALTRRQLVSASRMPVSWSEQEAMFGFC